MVTDFLTTFKKITLDHNTLNEIVKFLFAVTAVENFVYNTDLLFVFLIRIRMICIYNDSWIFEVFLAVQIIKMD